MSDVFSAAELSLWVLTKSQLIFLAVDSINVFTLGSR